MRPWHCPGEGEGAGLGWGQGHPRPPGGGWALAADPVGGAGLSWLVGSRGAGGLPGPGCGSPAAMTQIPLSRACLAGPPVKSLPRAQVRPTRPGLLLGDLAQCGQGASPLTGASSWATPCIVELRACMERKGYIDRSFITAVKMLALNGQR